MFLKAGEQKKVTIPFDDKTFRYWNTKTNSWEIEAGEYTVYIGANVADIRLEEKVLVEGTTEEFPYDPEEMPALFLRTCAGCADDQFEKLLGHRFRQESGPVNWESMTRSARCITQRAPIARFIYKKLTQMKKKSEDAGKPDLNILFIYNMPFRAVAKMTGGAVSMEMVHGITLR